MAEHATWDPSSFQVEPEEGKTRFHDLELPPEIMHAVADLGFKFCTPIQAGILPNALQGGDASGKAQTGTGKTAAFLITMFARFLRHPLPAERKPGQPRGLVLAPTRELAIQIEKEAQAFGKYTSIEVMAVFGGMDYEKQKQRLLARHVDIIVATPGRLIDYKKQRALDLSKIEVLVIDEADRMLDMGFIPDVRSIIYSTPKKEERQTMLFSATLTEQVTRLASQWTTDSHIVEIEPDRVAVDTVNQKVFITTAEEKFPLLYNIIKQAGTDSVIVFGNRRDATQNLTDKLEDYGISCALLSGAVAQTKRLKTLEAFREGKIQVLVATDVAGRGIHIDDVAIVINYNLPLDPEDYVHRIGRTGRAGSTGTSISFACEDDSFYIPDIEQFMGQELLCTHPEEELLQEPPAVTRRPRKPREPQRGGPPRGGRNQGGRSSSGQRRGGGAGRRPHGRREQSRRSSN